MELLLAGWPFIISLGFSAIMMMATAAGALDGQYTEEELSSSSQTFGHGTPLCCVEQGVACCANHVVIHHHDIRRTDTNLDKMAATLESHLTQGPKALGMKVQFAAEGDSWDL